MSGSIPRSRPKYKIQVKFDSIVMHIYIYNIERDYGPLSWRGTNRHFTLVYTL